jgi:hypothetical protein
MGAFISTFLNHYLHEDVRVLLQIQQLALILAVLGALASSRIGTDRAGVLDANAG